MLYTFPCLIQKREIRENMYTEEISTFTVYHMRVPIHHYIYIYSCDHLVCIWLQRCYPADRRRCLPRDVPACRETSPPAERRPRRETSRRETSRRETSRRETSPPACRETSPPAMTSSARLTNVGTQREAGHTEG